MTTYTNNDDSVLPEPVKHIGAQDIVSFRGGCTKNGFLRKQGGLERMFKCLTWRQRYVVIAQGCLYIFKNEFSRSYVQAVTLGTYSKTIRCNEIPGMPFVFRVMPHDPERGKILIFSCPDETNQKSWMAAIKKDLMRANNVALEDINLDILGEYAYLEKDVRTIKNEVAASHREPDPEKDYSEISDLDLGTRFGPSHQTPHLTSSLPTPTKPNPVLQPQSPKSSTIATAKPTSPVNNRAKKPQPTPNKPKSNGKGKKEEEPVIDRKSYGFNGTDRSHVEGLLLSKTEGTFLVRTSRSDDREVLSVNIGDCLKEYKIFVKDNKCTIDHRNYFVSTDDLLLYYHKNNLPNKNVKLTKAYLLQSAGYCNQRYTPAS